MARSASPFLLTHERGVVDLLVTERTSIWESLLEGATDWFLIWQAIATFDDEQISGDFSPLIVRLGASVEVEVEEPSLGCLFAVWPADEALEEIAKGAASDMGWQLLVLAHPAVAIPV